MLPPPAITISRQYGCLGSEVGFRVARTLNWAFCDRRVLRLAAEDLGLSAPDLERKEEHKTRILDRIFQVFAMGDADVPYSPALDLPIYSRDLFRIEADMMRHLADQHASVFVGRGGFVALAGRSRTLHTHIRGDMENRIQNLLRQGYATNPAEARKAILKSDASRGGFIRQISGKDWDSPETFDLVLDCANKTSEMLADEITRAFRARYADTSRESD